MRNCIKLTSAVFFAITLTACSSNSFGDSAATAGKRTLENQQQNDQRDHQRSSDIDKEAARNGGIAFLWCWFGLADCG
jgi:major membrane immunogen (membrane-anchored lipoprotein)